MKAKLVIPKGWRRLRVWQEMKKGDKIFSKFEDDLKWVDVIECCMINGLACYGTVMKGENMTTIRRIGK